MTLRKVKLSPEKLTKAQEKRRVGRPRKHPEQGELLRLQALSKRQDDAIAQSLDEINELRTMVEFYRKQVNHLIALLNILTKGS